MSDVLYSSDELNISLDGETLTINGELSGENSSEFLWGVLKDILAKGIPRLEINVRGLKIVNSSSLKSFIRLINNKSKDQKIVFISNPAHRWQKSSLLVLKTFDYDNVIIKEVK